MRIKWLAKFLLPRLKKWAETRKPNFEIVKDADPITFERLGKFTGVEVPYKEIYLRRWWLVRRNDWLNVYLHNMVRDDDAVLHDHSYWSVSLVLSDGLRENFQERPPQGFSWTRFPKQGDLVFRSSTMAHQLCVLPGTDPWTIFITGPRIKSWGFYCPQGFREWFKYTSVKQVAGQRGTGTSGVGVGCGEE